MRSLHPAAWVGFLLNCALIYIFFFSLANIDLSQLGEEDRAVFSLLLENIESFRFFFYGAIAAQGVGLGLLASRLPFGLAAAILGALPLVPASLVYLIGCLVTHANNKYIGFSQTPPDYSKARAVFASALVGKMRIASGVAIGASLLAVFIGFPNMATVCFGISLAALFFAVRSRKNPTLAIFDNFFTLTPGVYTSSILIPYSSVRRATLNPDQSIFFEVESPEDARVLPWSLRSVEPQERRRAMEELGAALSANGVQLAQNAD